MNPQMFQQAQAMMNNMTPEQKENMQRMVQNMSPEEISNMQRMASSMGMAPGGMGPAGGQTRYVVNGARMIKDEGNSLHKAGNHAAAIEKYERAAQNLASLTAPEAKELKLSCELNKAMCHLKLEQWKPCEQVCSQVLQGGANLKALYRRGQAYMGQQRWSRAIKDLEQALNMCPPGDMQRDLIAAKLSESKENVGTDPESPPAEKTAASYNDGSVTIEDVTEETYTPPVAGTSSASMPASGVGSAAEAKQMLDAMCNLPEEQLAATARAAGMPGMDSKTTKQMAEMMRGMDPEQLQNMMKMSEQLQGARARSGATGSGGGMQGQSPADVAMAAEMMQNMSPEQMADMAKVAAESGMLPEGMNLNPEMIKQSAEMMKNMSPEDMQRMQAMAMSAQQRAGGASGATGSATGGGQQPGAAAGGAAMPAGPGGMPTNVSDMLKDPEAMKTAMNMMKNMDEEQLVNIMKMSQPNMSEADAKRMAQQMKNMDDRVMNVLMHGASKLAQAREKAVQAKDWLLRNPAAMIAIGLLILAVILRWWGIM